jgi:hypothetical protein
MPTTDWKWAKVQPLFDFTGCSVQQCPFAFNSTNPAIFFCALNLSDALLKAPYTLPAATNVNVCAHGRVRNADGMARTCRAQNGGAIDQSGWANRPAWNGIAYFEGGPSLGGATGHIDLYDGTTRDCLHKSYSDAAVVWFWKLG